MIRTRVFIVAAISASTLFVVGLLAWRTISGVGGGPGTAATSPEVVRIQVVTALPVEEWVRGAADEFSEAGHGIGGAAIEVEVVPMDGLIALGKWERNDFAALKTGEIPDDLSLDEFQSLESFPAAWIADSGYLVDIANAANRERFGQDRFLSDGQYRLKPLARTLLVWGLFRSRVAPLLENLGSLTWNTVHKAAVAPTGWKELGGDPAWGNFKLAVTASGRGVGGPAAVLTAAGEFFDRTKITVEDLSDPEFGSWLAELMWAATGPGGGGTSAAESVAVFGYTAGDGGQFLESDLLQNMEGIQARWREPMVLHYPSITTWFDFPFAIWVGPETSAAQKNAALAFQQFLLSEAQQRKAVAFGLRPADGTLPVDAVADSPFERWQRLGVQKEGTGIDEMYPTPRELLAALDLWRELDERP